MTISEKNLVMATIQLSSGVVLRHVQDEMIIVDKDGNVIEGAKQIEKPDCKNMGDSMVETFLKAGIDFSESPEEKAYREVKEMVDNWLK